MYLKKYISNPPCYYVLIKKIKNSVKFRKIGGLRAINKVC